MGCSYHPASGRAGYPEFDEVATDESPIGMLRVTTSWSNPNSPPAARRRKLAGRSILQTHVDLNGNGVWQHNPAVVKTQITGYHLGK